ncbi:MAG TPA: ATP phosphoribosyltransferase regulatory subunit [Thermopetrobacter sp.]|nr:ATP phosphoribosyltransferase regulatory subunit [Thermopetrobacter sp.]
MDALAAQNAAIIAMLQEAGFAPVDPPIMQPADVFLEKSGEAIRARTYLFADPDGRTELCLRPDLTVPVCRWHLETAADPEREARYCYCGDVFRHHGAADALTPNEYPQAGLEWFGVDDAAADAAVMRLALEALKVAGVSPAAVTIGDVGLIRALLDSIDMPARWRARLLLRFHRPEAFHATLAAMRAPAESAAPALAATTLEEAVREVEHILAERGLAPVGRQVEEIAARLLEKALDARAAPLTDAQVALIERLLAISGPAADCVADLRALAAEAGGPMVDAVARFGRLVEALEGTKMHFDAAFGRGLDYYTGFVFQIDADCGSRVLPVAGGGRYDDMLESLGGPAVPACGFAVHTVRLLAAGGGA